MPPRNQSGIGGKLGPQAGAGASGPYVTPPTNPTKVLKPKPAAPPQAAQSTLRGFLGKLIGPIIRVDGAATALNPNAPMEERVGGAVSAGFPLIGATYDTLLGAYNSGKNSYGGMSAIVDADLSAAVKPPKKESGRLDDPIAGKGPDSNQVGSEVDKSTWKRPVQDVITDDDDGETKTPPSEGQGGDTTKVSPTGIVQKGKSLSSANASLAALGIAPLQDAGRFIDGGQGFKIETPAPEGTKAEDVDFSTDDGIAFGMTEGEAAARAAGNTIETVITPTSAGTTGKNTEDPQEGASDKPNNADKVRAVRFKRRDGAMSFNGADFSGDEPDNSKLTSPMYANSARNAARSAFLDAPAGQGVMGAIRARDAAVGVHEDGVLLNGKFREFAPGLDQKTKTAARYAATGGAFNTKEGLDEWTGNFLAPDSEATPEKATPQTEQEFDLSGVDEKTKELVGMTQSPVMSKDIPEMSSQEEADKFLATWKKKVGV